LESGDGESEPEAPRLFDIEEVPRPSLDDGRSALADAAPPGSSGPVWAAWHPGLAKRVVVKLPRPLGRGSRNEKEEHDGSDDRG
jgi:hypothetical protein